MEYLYTTPLDQARREFRLLHLLPYSAGSQSARTVGHDDSLFPQQRNNQPISCLLEKALLDDCHTYTALSYTWGDASRTKQIRINDKLIHITENLEIALQHLRQEIGTLTLWVDAICINQGDTDEKNSQVRQMTDIFRNARQVIIWLGPATDGSDKVIHYLDLIGKQWEKHELNGIGPAELIAMMRDPENEHNALMKSRLKDVFRCLDYLFPNQFPITQYHAFCRRGWWYRAWVIQELSVAQDPMFQCGKRRIQFDHLNNASHFLLAYGWFRFQRINVEHDSEAGPKPEYENTLPLLSNNASDTMLAFRRQYLKQEGHTLYSLLRTACAKPEVTRIVAADKRDLIFALLGIASDKNQLDIKVDYALTARDVYINASKALLICGHLELLSLCQTKKSLSDLPSWVCDWSATVYWPFGDSTHVEKPFTASANSVPRVLIYTDDEQHVAVIQGLLVDKIEIVGCHLPERVIDPSNPEAPDWNAANAFVSETERVCIGYSDEEIATILLGGLEYSSAGDESTLIQHRRVTVQTHEGYKWLKKWLEIAREVNYMNNNPIEFLPDGRPVSQVAFEERRARMDKTTKGMNELTPHIHKECSAFWSSLTIARSLDRTPFRSRKGYAGLGPKEMHPGDTICIFFGSYLPHVLRSAPGGRYTLIGEAYVHGIMDGELMEDTYASTDFELC